LFGLGFLPNSLAGWLIIILIILIIVLIARHFWNRPQQTNMIVHTPVAPTPVAPQQTIITGAPTGEYTVYQPTPKQ
jgi:FtsZ-interacting cell division protein ZipA